MQGAEPVAQPKSHKPDAATRKLLRLLNNRPLVLIGMMGAGKTTVGRRLAARLNRTFIDSDAEIETAAGMSIEDYFTAHGEAEFRAGEARVIARLLERENIVLGTGGGAFINSDSRSLIKQKGVSIWLKADFELLFARVSRRSNRPLLKTANPRQTLQDLIDARYPIYCEAEVTVNSRDVPHEVVADSVITAVTHHLGGTTTKA
jgi:shikimate kinase